MTLDEAIRLLEQDTSGIDYDYDPRLPEAEKLGIEALKWRQLMEHDYGSWCGPLLQGETKDEIKEGKDD